jgi:hypothetical protein
MGLFVSMHARPAYGRHAFVFFPMVAFLSTRTFIQFTINHNKLCPPPTTSRLSWSYRHLQPAAQQSRRANLPIAIKTVRDCDEEAMKIIAKIENSIPFRSSTDDEDSLNELRAILEDLFVMKKDAESAAAEVKEGEMAKKKKDRVGQGDSNGGYRYLVEHASPVGERKRRRVPPLP